MNALEDRRARKLRKGALALRALASEGTPKAAAASQGVGEDTLRRRIADYCSLMGFQTDVQAAYWLDHPEKHNENPQIADFRRDTSHYP